jgi:serine/threonine protein kinase
MNPASEYPNDDSLSNGTATGLYEGQVIADRFEIVSTKYLSPLLDLYLGIDRSTRSEVWVFGTARRELVARWRQLDEAIRSCPQIQQILAFGAAQQPEYFYLVTETPPDEGVVNLRLAATELTSSDKRALITQLCSVLEKVNHQGIAFVELSPDLVLLDQQSGKLRMLLLPPSFSYSGVSWGLLNPENNRGLPFESILNWVVLGRDNNLQEMVQILKSDDLGLENWAYAAIHPYIAPECVADKPTPASDVFSLGILLYWLWSQDLPLGDVGVRPVHSNLLNIRGVVWAAVVSTAERSYLAKLIGKDLSEDNAIPGELRPIIRKAIAADVHHRYHSARQLANALMAIQTKTLRVLVTDEAGRPLSDHQVIVEHGDNSSILIISKPLKGSTNTAGICEFAGLLPGPYQVRVAGNKDFINSGRVSVVIATRHTGQEDVEIILRSIPWTEKFRRSLRKP